MSLKDFLWGTKKSTKYGDMNKPQNHKNIPKKEPLKKVLQEEKPAVDDSDKVRRQQMYGRPIETPPKSQVYEGTFYDLKKTIYKDVIVLVIENSVYTRSYKDKILQVAKKIVESNKECFFLLMRMGDDKKIYQVINYDMFEEKKIFDNWFDESISQPCDYIEVINYIDEYYKSIIIDFNFQDVNDKETKKYSIQNINIVFIGSGNAFFDKETKKECSELIKKLKGRMKVKSIKYFCTLDSQTINVAKLGFPVIGHIETDFYK